MLSAEGSKGRPAVRPAAYVMRRARWGVSGLFTSGDFGSGWIDAVLVKWMGNHSRLWPGEI